MPKSAPTRCTTPACGRIATKRGRCDEHEARAWERTSRRNLELDKATWNRTQREHLRMEPSCRACGTDQALTVDHITEVADGGALYDHGNLQTLCDDCHTIKSQLAAAARRSRAADDIDADH